MPSSEQPFLLQSRDQWRNDFWKMREERDAAVASRDYWLAQLELVAPIVLAAEKWHRLPEESELEGVFALARLASAVDSYWRERSDA